MPTTVELISPTDTLTLHATPDVSGWVYNNDTLDAWYKLAQAEPNLSKRPNAHGTYSPGQIFTKEAEPIVNGQFFGANPTLALIAKNRINALFNDGNPITMRVTDELGPTTREVWVVDTDPRFVYDFSYFPFDIVLVAPDPRRYGATVTDSEGMPSAGSGLVWNLNTGSTYFDWGTPGVLGRVEFTNPGNAAMLPRIDVGGAGAFAAGFRVTEIETGRELTVVRPTSLGDIVVLDSRTERATISNGGGDITGSMTSREWFSIPAGQTRRYQINPLGSVSGAPTITIYAAPAYL